MRLDLLLAAGKAGLAALVDRTNMGHELDADAGVLQTWQADPIAQFAIFNSALWNRPDGPVFYVWGLHDALRAFQMQNGLFNSTAMAINSTAPSALPFSGMTVSSNAFVPGSGLFWATTASLQELPAAGALHAFNAMDVSQELWNSDMQGGRDTLGNFAKFANPTVANGKVYVPTDSGQVVAYGLLPVPGIAAVVNAGSFTVSTVAPGELISVFGTRIGPTGPLELVLDAQGKVSASLGGYVVSFDGIPAPLLYASAGQINAVVPFSVAGQPTTVMQVVTPGGATFNATLAVSSVAPAMFAVETSGQGAILNADYSVNAPGRAAARGSYVSIYATGTGLLAPAVADGTVIPAGNPPVSAATVSVAIGGQPATVSYQGAAPGLVAGVMQINVLVPAGVTPGAAVPVTISAGGTAGLNTVTMAIE